MSNHLRVKHTNTGRVSSTEGTNMHIVSVIHTHALPYPQKQKKVVGWLGVMAYQPLSVIQHQILSIYMDTYSTKDFKTNIKVGRIFC